MGDERREGARQEGWHVVLIMFNIILVSSGASGIVSGSAVGGGRKWDTWR